MGTYERIKDLCKSKGIAITVLEQKLGFGRGTIGKWKKDNNPSASKLRAVAEYLDVDEKYLLTGETDESGYYLNPETAALAQQMFEDPQMRSLFHMKRNMSADRFQAHYQILKDMYKLEHPEDDDIGC